jgi:hypothetical protein
MSITRRGLALIALAVVTCGAPAAAIEPALAERSTPALPTSAEHVVIAGPTR